MAVITTVEFNDFVAPREPTRQADGRHRGFRPRVAHSHLLHAGNQLADQPRHRDFEWIRNPEAGSILRRLLNSFSNSRMRMPKNGRTPGADVINILVPIHVPDPRALGPIDEKRLPSYRPERAHG